MVEAVAGRSGAIRSSTLVLKSAEKAAVFKMRERRVRSTERRFKRAGVDKVRRRGESDGGQALDVCDCRDLVDEGGVGRRLLVQAARVP